MGFTQVVSIGQRPDVFKKAQHNCARLIFGEVLWPEKALNAQTVEKPDKCSVHRFGTHLELTAPITKNQSQELIKFSQSCGTKFLQATKSFRISDYIQPEFQKE
jgi:hypothetical protein